MEEWSVIFGSEYFLGLGLVHLWVGIRPIARAEDVVDVHISNESFELIKEVHANWCGVLELGS